VSIVYSLHHGPLVLILDVHGLHHGTLYNGLLLYRIPWFTRSESNLITLQCVYNTLAVRRYTPRRGDSRTHVFP